MSTEQERAQKARANRSYEERIAAALEQIADAHTKIAVDIRDIKMIMSRPSRQSGF